MLNSPENKKFFFRLLPSPAPERGSVRGKRQKIVAYLDKLSEKVQKLRQVQAETAADLSALRQSLLQQAFGRAGIFTPSIQRQIMKKIISEKLIEK
mgnify:CR=1 FL=1